MSETHYQACPQCYEMVLCGQGCDAEPDLGTYKGLPVAPTVECDACEEIRASGDARIFRRVEIGQRCSACGDPADTCGAIALTSDGSKCIALCAGCWERGRLCAQSSKRIEAVNG